MPMVHDFCKILLFLKIRQQFVEVTYKLFTIQRVDPKRVKPEDQWSFGSGELKKTTTQKQYSKLIITTQILDGTVDSC